jgi:Amt family ammonium transporter
MTPGVAFFYGGLARSKNAVNVIGMTFLVVGLISVQWVLFGYSLAFGPNDTDANKMMGSLEYVGFNHVSSWAPLGEPGPCTDSGAVSSRAQYVPNPDAHCSMNWPGTVPHQLFADFQAVFAIITPALIIGGLIDRLKFSAFVIFVLLWATFVYDPIAHWVWGGGFIGGGSIDLNPDLSPSFALDFAGGTVIHITSGFAGLASALILGRRLGYGKVPMEPHNVPMVVLGASILWFGWFGFNAGSAIASGMLSTSAFVATHIAGAAGALSWAVVEWIYKGKPTTLGVASGAVAGLATVTPAAGFVAPWAALVIGLTTSLFCYVGVVAKNKFGYEDSLDVVGIHGVGGTWGVLATGLFASKAVNPAGNDGLFLGNPSLLGVQALSVVSAWVYSFVMTLMILKILDWTMGLRVSEEHEVNGLDLSQHGEAGYSF